MLRGMRSPALLVIALLLAMLGCSKPVPLTGAAARTAACSAIDEYFKALGALRRDPERVAQDLSKSHMRELILKAVENGERSNDERIKAVASQLGQDVAILESGAGPSIDPDTGRYSDSDTAAEDAGKQQAQFLHLCGLPNPLASPSHT